MEFNRPFPERWRTEKRTRAVSTHTHIYITHITGHITGHSSCNKWQEVIVITAVAFAGHEREKERSEE
jgi:hypothetical protein